MNKDDEIIKSVLRYINDYINILDKYTEQKPPHFIRNLKMMRNNIEIYFSNPEIEKAELFDSLNYEWKQCFQGRSSISVFEIVTDDFELNQSLNSQLDGVKNTITALLAMQKEYCALESLGYKRGINTIKERIDIQKPGYRDMLEKMDVYKKLR